MPVDVTVPSVGESITEVFVGAWLKQPGDAVKRDDPLVELETDKATVEVPSPVDGVLAEQLFAVGDAAQVGDVIARVDAADTGASAGDAAATEKSPPAASESTAAGSEPAASEPAAAAPTDAGDAKVMPAAQRALDEAGMKAGDVAPTGPGGRVLKEDVARAVEAKATAAPAQAAAPTPAAKPAAAPTTGGDREEEVVPMSPLRRKVAERLVQAQQTAALLTTFNEIDMSAVMALRSEHKDAFEKRHGVRLGFMSFFVRATIEALREFPQLNAEIREQSIVYKNYYDIGVAVSTPKGLMVPVLRDAQRLSFAQIEAVIGDFGKRAGGNKIAPDELQGGTFTITNGGVFGSLLSTPIVNPPQSGVLGMHAIQQRPIAVEGQVVIRPMMYVALTYDHRIVDGREAVTFLRRIKEGVEQPARMLLEV
ncbi:MAG: 2-oxoglutarate dehydrogenase complex dihydrolipoyllysine-residue succinyltransferase [Trueperaceae bacterium]|nr:2-oxoglutarate dehydrogenase complex dihydrolipoyllysine-residue succinyltransferase [Trueperaceae bacterium]